MELRKLEVKLIAFLHVGSVFVDVKRRLAVYMRRKEGRVFIYMTKRTRETAIYLLPPLGLFRDDLYCIEEQYQRISLGG